MRMRNAGESEPLLLVETSARPKDAKRSHRRTAAVVVVIVLITIVLSTVVAIVLTTRDDGDHNVSNRASYRSAALITDHEACSRIGRSILRDQNGSAVDAAVAVVLCIGVTGPQASGIGGGHFMTIYDTPRDGREKEVMMLDARDVAPLASTQDMLENTTSSKGPLFIAVPGELKGLDQAWSRYGRLPWKQLVQPSIDLCEQGFSVSRTLAYRIGTTYEEQDYHPSVRHLLVKPDGTMYKEGDIMKRPTLAKTLRIIANEGPLSMYSGTVKDLMLEDLKEAGSIITAEDLHTYDTVMGPGRKVKLGNGSLDLYVPGLPSGGPIFQFLLRVLEGFKFEPSNARNNPKFHQAVIETFKFGFALRSFLGDERFVDMSEVKRNLSSPEFLSHVQSLIDLDHTHKMDYYGSAYLPIENHGTSCASVVAADGSAVALTTSVNGYFGSTIVGSRTGIVFNDGMDDFSTPNTNNEWGIRPSAANFISPGKRPLSSMSPTVILDHKTGRPRLVIGGAGGSQITTMVALTSYLNLMLGLELPESIDFPRVHNQLIPNTTLYEPHVDKNVIRVLTEEMGQTLVPESFIAVVCGIERRCDKEGSCEFTAVGDWRRDAIPSGF